MVMKNLLLSWIDYQNHVILDALMEEAGIIERVYGGRCSMLWRA